MSNKSSLNRCPWSGSDPLYISYHDKEWGVPVFDDQKLFEMLTLESAQAGLSWITILRRREFYRESFCNFEPSRVALLKEKDIQQLMKNKNIIRNEKKIRAAIQNAKSFISIQDEFGSFRDYSWALVGHKPLQNNWKSMSMLPATTELSVLFSKDLKSRGFSFLGPTSLYAHMQASGMVNDHLVGCFRHSEVKRLSPPNF